MINNKELIKILKEKKDYNFVLTLNKKDFHNLKDNSNVMIKDGCVDNIFGIKIVCIKGLKKSKLIYLGKDYNKNGFIKVPNPNFVEDLK